MEALKNNDVERYRQILLEQQTSVPGEAAERYEVLSSFLSQTEDYLHKLGSKITAAKNQQEMAEAANAASLAARAQVPILMKYLYTHTHIHLYIYIYMWLTLKYLGL